MASDLNNGALNCRLARDPELRSLASGTSVLELRVAWTTSRKNGQTGEWEDKSNYGTVKVWGKQAESLARNLQKGSRIGVSYRLEHREWKTQEGQTREVLELVASQVQYLDPKGTVHSAPATSGGASQTDFAPPPADDDDVPF